MATNNGRLRFDLEINANSKSAKQEIQQLGEMLNQLATKNLKLSLTQNISEDIKQASREVGEFSALLSKSFNADTGKLDLSKLSTSLKAANTDITKVAQSFAALGNDGTMAFASVVKQINAAEVPLKKTNKLIDDMWVSLKNTMKWQISSSAIHALQSGLSGAYGYAQDLNKSLNEIRIVTGYNIDQMTEFAAAANKAAKALSTTTTTYTDASLIYYQQGLTDQEVLDRTEITIKMANAAGASAAKVSDQLTSVWNNFYDGSKSLAYYADVMTALGAATASSTDEIAEGLEKFAAIAETVGLSYDYAATALATVTATTRQSADVVGTAFKTLFARMQDLELGKTLDDGTTLGSYSAALQTVGVDIKEANGEMKDMDAILDELGAKWRTLSQDTKVALAQTVAGTRQYTQLVALMDNWDYFQENLSVAKSSSGTLDKQAEIYAESWEAAQKRVKASLESLYTTIIDDEFFIKLTDTVAKLIDGIKNMVNGLGGVKGLLATISTYVLTIGRTKISEELIRLTGPSQKKQAEIIRQQKNKANEALVSISASGSGRQGELLSKEYSKIKDLNDKIYAKADNLSEAEREVLHIKVQQYEKMVEMVALQAKELDQQEQAAKIEQKRLAARQANAQKGKKIDESGLRDIYGRGNILSTEGNRSKPLTQEDIDKINQVRKNLGMGKNSKLSEAKVEVLTREKLSDPEAEEQRVSELRAALQEIAKEFDNTIDHMKVKTVDSSLEQYKKDAYAVAQILEEVTAGKGMDRGNDGFWKSMSAEMKNAVELAAGGTEKFNELTDKLKTQNGQLDINSEEYSQFIDCFIQAQEKIKEGIIAKNADVDEKAIRDIAEQYETASFKVVTLANGEKALKKTQEDVNSEVDKGNESLPEWQDQLVSAASIVTSCISIFSTLSGIIDTISNPDMSGWEKFTTILTTLLTLIPSIIGVFNSLKASRLKDTALLWLNTVALKANTAATKENAESGAKGVKKAGEAGAKTLKDAAANAGGWGKLITSATSSLLPYIAVIAGIAAIIAVCVAAYKALNNKLNENEIAAQKAEEAAKNLGEAYNEAKANYDDLINTISSYNSAKDGIAELTRGTAEFSAAIQDANDEALKLLDTYGDIIGNRYSVDADGLISIDQDALEDVKKQESSKTKQAQSASIIANQQARDARMKADITELNRDKIKSSEGLTGEDAKRAGEVAAITAAVGAVAGGIIGSVIPIFGTAAGSAAGLALGAALGTGAGAIVGGGSGLVANWAQKNSETDEEQAAVNQLLKDYTVKGNAVFDDAYIDKIANGNKSLAEELKKNKESLEELAKEMKANTIATNAENAAMAASILSDNSVVQESRHADKVSVFAADTYADSSQQAYEKYAANRNNNLFATGTSTSRELFERYAKAKGITDYDVTNYKRNGGVTYKYTDKETGEQKEANISANEIAAVLAAQDAEAATNESGEKIAKILDNLGDVSVELLSAAKSGDMSKATIGELGNGISAEIQNMSVEDLQALGFEGTKSEILQQIRDQQKASLDDIRKYADAYQGVASDVINQVLDTNDKTFENISQAALKQYATILNDLSYSGGEETAKQFDIGLQGIMDKYANKSSEIMAAANNIDWSLGDDALQEFNYQLLKMGVNIDENSDEWKAMVKAMQGVNVSILNRDLDTIRSKIASIKKLTEGIEIGGIISDEDYDSLVKYNAALKDMFIMTADGYKYIGGDIANSGSEYAKKQLETMKKENDLARKMGDYFGSIGWTNGEKEDWYGLANGTDSDARMSSMADFLMSNLSEDEVKLLGADIDNIKSSAATLTDSSASADQKKNAKAELQKFYDSVLQLKNNYENELYDDSKAEEIYASTATSIDELNKMVEEGSIAAANWIDGQQNAYEKQATLLTNSALSTATTYGDVQAAAKEAIENGIVVDQEQYQAALQRIAEDYETCSDELAIYARAIDSGDKSLIDHAENLLAAAMAAEELAKAYGLDAEELAWYVDALEEKGVYQAADKKTLSEIAKEQMRFDKAVTSSLDSMDTWKQALTDTASKGRVGFETIKQLREGYGDLLDIDGTKLSNSFLTNTENLELMEQALNGNTEAYAQLQKLAAEDYIKKAELNVNQQVVDQLLAANGFEMGAEGQSLAGSQLEQDLLEIINLAKMTAEEANMYLSTIGIDVDADGEEGNLRFNSISKSTSLTSKYNLTSAFDNFDPNKIELTKYDEIVDRYKEIDDKMSDINREMEQANKQADRFYGTDKIKSLEKVNELLEEQQKLTKDKIALTEDRLKTDADYLISAGQEAGVSFQVDGNGNITNYKSAMEELYSQLSQMEQDAMADGNVSETEQEEIDNLREKIEAVTDALNDYDDTKESLKDLNEELQDQFYEWQDNNFEQLNLKLELELELKEDELSWLDHQLSIIEDDFYSAAGGVALLGSKTKIYNEIAVSLNNNMDELEMAYKAGKISEADYVEGMKNIQQQAISNADAMRALKTEMEEYYGKTIQTANEELEKQKKGYESVTKTLDHYKNIMSILGEEENEEWLNEMLATQAQHTKNQLDSATQVYQMYADEEAYWRQQMEAARERGDTELYELYKKNWEAASDAMTEAQDEMLTKTEEWAQALRDEVENELKNLGSDLEKSLTGGVSFDDLTTAMERKNSLQEEYLTTTNQIYETNKLMRTAESEIAKTSSTVAKNRLKDYVNETKQMQEQGKLSKFELEMQQAKYDLLLAEIALDEAQNAKSTVRLQRDAEGNYGYVYTADADKVSAAQQAYDDADNAYYNKSLEGANNYAQKYVSTMQEMYDTITSIMNDFTLSDAEKDEKIRAAKEYYYEKLGQYSELYSVAVQADSRALQEAWTSDWGFMTTKTDELKSSVDKYVSSAKDALQSWNEKVESIKNNTGLSDTTTALSGLAEQSDSTKESISGLVDSLVSGFAKIDAAIIDPDFTSLYTSLDTAVTKFEAMANAARDAWRAAAQAENASTPDKKYTGTTSLTGGGSNTTPPVTTTTLGDQQQSNYSPPEQQYEYKFKPASTITSTVGGGGGTTGSHGSTVQKPKETSSEQKWGTITQMIGYAGSRESAKDWQAWGELSAGTLVSPEVTYVTSNFAKGGGRAVGVNLKSTGELVWVTQKAYDNYIKFDTGGYTGEWGSSGKLAMLHEKELVLNKNQTQDLLTGMEILDKIIQMIDLQALNSSLGGALSSPNYYGNNANALEQNVHIEASFPNATNHNEIEEAFRNLTNLASQYANRK